MGIMAIVAGEGEKPNPCTGRSRSMMTSGFRQHSPAILDAQLGEDDGERHIAAERDEDDDRDPHLQLGADEDAGRHHIEELRHDVEQDCTGRRRLSHTLQVPSA